MLTRLRVCACVRTFVCVCMCACACVFLRSLPFPPLHSSHGESYRDLRHRLVASGVACVCVCVCVCMIEICSTAVLVWDSAYARAHKLARYTHTHIRKYTSGPTYIAQVRSLSLSLSLSLSVSLSLARSLSLSLTSVTHISNCTHSRSTPPRPPPPPTSTHTKAFIVQVWHRSTTTIEEFVSALTKKGWKVLLNMLFSMSESGARHGSTRPRLVCPRVVSIRESLRG